MRPVSGTLPARVLASDDRLTGARLLGDPRRLRRWLLSHGLIHRGASPPRSEILKYRPGRRIAAILHRGLGRTRLVIKGYRKSRARSVAETYAALERALSGDPSLILPPLVLYDAETGTLVWKYVRGRPVVPERGALVSGERYRPRLEAAGRVLARIHASPLELDRRWRSQEEIDLLRQRATRGAPGSVELAGKICRLLARSGGRHGLIHRDFYPQQILEALPVSRPKRRLVIVDWDEAAQGPPLLDLGNALAHLELLGLRSPRQTTKVAAMRGALLRGYRTGQGGIAGADDWQIWEASALLRLSTLAWGRHRGEDRVWRAPKFRPRDGCSPADEAIALLERATSAWDSVVSVND